MDIIMENFHCIYTLIFKKEYFLSKLLIARGIPLLYKLDDFYWLLFEKSM